MSPSVAAFRCYACLKAPCIARKPGSYFNRIPSPLRRPSNGRGNWTGHATAVEIEELQNWLKVSKDLQVPSKLQLQQGVEGEESSGVGFVAASQLAKDELVYEIPGDVSVTLVDANEHPIVGPVIEGRSELIALSLWLMAERSADSESAWHPFLKTLPERTSSPILWSEAERAKHLAGSPILEEANSRANMLKLEWQSLHEVLNKNSATFPRDVFNEESFVSAFSVIMAYAVYLPSAKCFALLPSLFGIKRSGHEDSAALDYDVASGSVQLTARKNYMAGEEFCLFDGRPNGELLLSTGMIENDNPSDYLDFGVSLVQSERLYLAKREILQAMGFDIKEKFPVYKSRMPLQLFSYLRLSRVTDAAVLTQVNFEEDAIVSQINEYEILQLLLGDCRDGLTRYKTTIEEDVKLMQQVDLPAKEVIGRKLLFEEKKILQGAMDNVRSRLAPIRGIPTKSGLSNPNQEILDAFQAMEDLPQKPKEILDGFMSWAKGEQDPNWDKKKKR